MKNFTQTFRHFLSSFWFEQNMRKASENGTKLATDLTPRTNSNFGHVFVWKAAHLQYKQTQMILKMYKTKRKRHEQMEI